ncbi:hypothetical protein [Kitasatospora fiedleri]|uniref:hypothetical protein n=1 Tax=Kitasatospora fiedleri TaxID=2991545 RepID=UPI00249AFDA9|nr:hypothetical protein [Kitasatospora fiedleri]
MTSTVTQKGGKMEKGSESVIALLVGELDIPIDVEHPNVSICEDEDSRSISAFQSGALIFEYLEDGHVESRHISYDSPSEMVRLMAFLECSELAAVESLDWHPGYIP